MAGGAVYQPFSDEESAGGKAARPSRFLTFNRAEWAALRRGASLDLSESDLDQLRGLNEPVSLAEVVDLYPPLSRLVDLHVTAARGLGAAVETDFLGRPNRSTPYIISIAGSVAVGKSTFARLLQAVLARWPSRPNVELVATDGFLLPRRVLEDRGLMGRKGFPESYDLRQMLTFLASVKDGMPGLSIPIYSHQIYDIVPDSFQSIGRPDILIFEGLNVLQTVSNASAVASDFFDFSIYIDADQAVIEAWYVERFLMLQRTAFRNPTSYFHHYKDLTEAAADAVAREIWREINLRNLTENILPTRERANLVIRKGRSHRAEEFWLRRA
jgi:type I pantothenate kinase